MAGGGASVNVLDLFSGIGGFSLGLERAGMRTAAFCEIEPYCRAVLRKHWPNVPIYEDVRTLTAGQLRADGISVDVICGGFPCQDISVAGQKAGIVDGTRSGLWSEIVRLVRDVRPRYVVVENVANLLAGPSEQPGAWFGRVLGDLALCGFDAEWEVIPASAIGAPHPRERVWLVAYPNGAGPLRWSLAAHGSAGRPWCEEQFTRLHEHCIRVAIPTRAHGRIHDGVPRRVDRLRALGNSVVPQIPEIIGRAIMQYERERVAA
jgi:DNA (cytosine-5)-methyltransferase 1